MVIYLTSDGHTATNSIKITTNDDQAKVIPEFDENFMQLKNRIIIKKSAHPCQVIIWVKECDKAESGFQNATINGVQNTTIFII